MFSPSRVRSNVLVTPLRKKDLAVCLLCESVGAGQTLSGVAESSVGEMGLMTLLVVQKKLRLPEVQGLLLWRCLCSCCMATEVSCGLVQPT